MNTTSIYGKQSGHTAPRLFGCDAWNQVLPVRRTLAQKLSETRASIREQPGRGLSC